jgi:hypothetical protein
MWVEEILPAFDTHIRKKWVHTLWRAGIPTHLRRLVWPLAIGNRLEACALTRRTFFFFRYLAPLALLLYVCRMLLYPRVAPSQSATRLGVCALPNVASYVYA